MAFSAIKTDNSSLSRFDRGLLRVESSLNLASGAVIFALVLLATANILGRKFFNAPLPGFIDWVEQSMAVFAFAGLAYCQREGGHVRMDIVVQRIRGRFLWFAELLSVLFMFLVTSALIYGTWFHFLRSFDFSVPSWSRDSSIDINLPLWPAKLIVPLALSLLWIRLSLQIWGYGRALYRKDNNPVAVPVPRSAAEQATSESEAIDGS